MVRRNLARTERNMLGERLQQQWQHSQVGAELQWGRRSKITRNDFLLVDAENIHQNLVQVISSIVQGRRQRLFNGLVREVVRNGQLVR
ncbi:UNVERIFIED_CONTAM: hypothetical protein ACS92_06950 [Bacillus cereus]